ncbi:MAG: recombination protein O N-terminal domain-containing protein [Candidatus Kaiserbacteria bacterium]|nr:recombination protein O N-terminal domain-containing protein [Candidatus Kaiserbacteria bacterium]
MPYPVINTRAVILHTHPTGEANRVLTLLTEQHGTLQVFARSVRKETSRMRSAAVPYALVSSSIILSRQHILKDLRVIDPLQDIWNREPVYTSYVALLRFVHTTVPAVGHHDPVIFSLVLDAIRSYTTRPPCQTDAILLTTQVFILHRLGYVHNPDLDSMSLSTVISDTTTSAKQQRLFKKQIKEGMTWQ